MNLDSHTTTCVCYCRLPYGDCRAMAAEDKVNRTQTEDSQFDQKPFNCCMADYGNYLGMDNSMELLGVQVILVLAYSLIILFGVTGNSLVIYVVYKFKNLRTVTNFFIINLAVADLLVNVLCLPLTLVQNFYIEWKFGKVMCFLVPFAQGMVVHVSTITMIVIALDRHRSIVYHMESQMSKEMCAGVIVVTWVLSAVLATPLAVFREYQPFDLAYDEHAWVCSEAWAEGNMSGSIYSISALLVQYVVPLAIISVAYAHIWNKLKKTGLGRSDRQRRRRKTTKMLLTMVAVFAISWLPFYAFQLAADIDMAVLALKDYKLLFTVVHIAAMCSTFVNPILYGWMNNNYKAAFLSVCKCYQPMSLRAAGPKGRQMYRDEGRVCTESKSTNV